MSNRHSALSRRERQIMDVLYRRGRATANEVLEALTDPPTNATIRTLLRVLEQKGHVQHEKDGAKYVFIPTLTPEKAKRSALRHLIQTFFEGSYARAVAALLDSSDSRLTKDEVSRLTKLIKE